VKKDESAHEAFEAQVAGAAAAIAEGAGIETEIAEGLVRGGLNSIEMIASGVDEVDIADVLEIDIEEAKAILKKVTDAAGGNAEETVAEETVVEAAVEETAAEETAAPESEAVSEEPPAETEEA
jgi:cell division ATPase FtsA